jgi:hypothetical protein
MTWNIIGNNEKREFLNRKSLKLLQSLIKVKLNKINLVLSSKIRLIVFNELLSFFMSLGFMFSYPMHLYANFEICILSPLNLAFKTSQTNLTTMNK